MVLTGVTVTVPPDRFTVRAFQIGFIVYLPFLVIDMIAASVLMAMGMMMLPPVIISLPFKIMLFVLVDGWSLIIGSLVKSFG